MLNLLHMFDYLKGVCLMLEYTYYNP